MPDQRLLYSFLFVSVQMFAVVPDMLSSRSSLLVEKFTRMPWVSSLPKTSLLVAHNVAPRNMT